ncbi:hypothetical protein Lal_00048208 [Lupinus albus]|uniref:Uncharacterized protein n=1 Tax=Lupinus albus TaxID=3870 RepID=A0A6A5M7D2_LUPAL|nr:hypothetical protein Lalb_Chr04g0252721 [Lupinus albus]KAF1868929.1 hypothetical protein Lal_00048208 [Lupinus albus]
MPKVMEKKSSHRIKAHRKGLSSCWGCPKLKVPCLKRRSTYKAIGGYDPLSYSQNFDDGNWVEDDEESARLGFSARFAAPSTPTKSLNGSSEAKRFGGRMLELVCADSCNDGKMQVM